MPGSPSEILSEAGGMSPEKVRCGIILHARERLLPKLEVYPQPQARFTPSPARRLLPEAHPALAFPAPEA